MAKYSMKVKGKEIGPASTYSTPHTMAGNTVKAVLKTPTGAEIMDTMNISTGSMSKGNYKPEKTDGIKIRGVGAATKGTMARGPMG